MPESYMRKKNLEFNSNDLKKAMQRMFFSNTQPEAAFFADLDEVCFFFHLDNSQDFGELHEAHPYFPCQMYVVSEGMIGRMLERQLPEMVCILAKNDLKNNRPIVNKIATHLNKMEDILEMRFQRLGDVQIFDAKIRNNCLTQIANIVIQGEHKLQQLAVQIRKAVMRSQNLNDNIDVECEAIIKAYNTLCDSEKAEFAERPIFVLKAAGRAPDTNCFMHPVKRKTKRCIYWIALLAEQTATISANTKDSLGSILKDMSSRMDPNHRAVTLPRPTYPAGSSVRWKQDWNNVSRLNRRNLLSTSYFDQKHDGDNQADSPRSDAVGLVPAEMSCDTITLAKLCAHTPTLAALCINVATMDEMNAATRAPYNGDEKQEEGGALDVSEVALCSNTVTLDDMVAAGSSSKAEGQFISPQEYLSIGANGASAAVLAAAIVAISSRSRSPIDSRQRDLSGKSRKSVAGPQRNLSAKSRSSVISPKPFFTRPIDSVAESQPRVVPRSRADSATTLEALIVPVPIPSRSRVQSTNGDECIPKRRQRRMALVAAERGDAFKLGDNEPLFTYLSPLGSPLQSPKTKILSGADGDRHYPINRRGVTFSPLHPSSAAPRLDDLEGFSLSPGIGV